jgi:hypothetical protein
MHLNNKVLETHLSTPISQTFALIAGDCNTTAFQPADAFSSILAPRIGLLLPAAVCCLPAAAHGRICYRLQSLLLILLMVAFVIYYRALAPAHGSRAEGTSPWRLVGRRGR